MTYEVNAAAVIASVRAHLYNEPMHVKLWLCPADQRKPRWWRFW